MRRRSRSLRTFLKIYVVAAFLWAAVSAPLALSFVPVLLLAGYVYQWRWRISPLVGLMTEYFMIFALTLLFSPFAGLAGAAVSLPVLVLLSFALEEYGRTITFDEAAAARAFTNIAVVNITIALAVMVVALMLGARALVLADAAVILYFAGTGFYVFRHLPAKAVEETPVQLRILVGNEEEVLIRLTSKTGVGGLRDLASIESAFALGVSRVVIGTAAIENPVLVSEAVARFGAERVAVGIDARDGMVATRGWREQSLISSLDLARQMGARGVTRIVYTDIARDGMLRGIDAAAVADFARAAGLRVIASGGVASVRDVAALYAHDEIEGVVIGQALYTGALSLKEAIDAGKTNHPLS